MWRHQHAAALGSDDLTLDQSATSIQILPEPAIIAGFIDIGSEMVEIWILDFQILGEPKS